MVSLKEMPEADFDRFVEDCCASYKQDKIRANGYTDAEAQKIVERDFSEILPQGFHTKDNFFFNVINEDSQKVGTIWYRVQGANDNRKAFLLDILIDEAFRGQGFGKVAMRLLEQQAKSQGLKAIGLHVFGFNEVAIRLYESLGYRTTDLTMEKSL